MGEIDHGDLIKGIHLHGVVFSPRSPEKGRDVQKPGEQEENDGPGNPEFRDPVQPVEVERPNGGDKHQSQHKEVGDVPEQDIPGKVRHRFSPFR